MESMELEVLYLLHMYWLCESDPVHQCLERQHGNTKARQGTPTTYPIDATTRLLHATSPTSYPPLVPLTCPGAGYQRCTGAKMGQKLFSNYTPNTSVDANSARRPCHLIHPARHTPRHAPHPLCPHRHPHCASPHGILPCSTPTAPHHPQRHHAPPAHPRCPQVPARAAC